DFNFFKINTRFQYAVLTFHFILLNEKKIKFHRGVRLMDDLGNTYSNLSKLAKATGGVQLTTAEPKFFFKRLQQHLVKGNVESEVVKESIGTDK
ncbi:MAG: hypothetical protein GY940_32145, partial [bacterium]|nr:hypothetical protein [bacterium]